MSNFYKISLVIKFNEIVKESNLIKSQINQKNDKIVELTKEVNETIE